MSFDCRCFMIDVDLAACTMDSQSAKPCRTLRLEKHSSSIRGADIRFTFVRLSRVSIPRGLTWLTGVVLCPRFSLFIDRYAFLHDGCYHDGLRGVVCCRGHWTRALDKRASQSRALCDLALSGASRRSRAESSNLANP